MHALVVDLLDGDADAVARALADALGKTLYECRPLANAPGGGPVVVAAHAHVDEANAMATRLRAAGFEVTVVPDTVAAPVRAFTGRSFVLGDAALSVEARDGRRMEIGYAEVDVLVRGSEITQHSATQTTTTRKLDLGRAVLTGGLMMTRKEKTKHTTTTSESHGFLVVYAGSAPPVALGEESLLYQSLGAAMQPSRMANFVYLATQLRQCCPQASWDERLMRRAAQQQILGPTLGPDEHLELAIALVAASAIRRRALRA